MRSILFPTDFSELSQGALRYTLSFASDLRAQLTIMNIYHPTNTALINALKPTMMKYLRSFFLLIAFMGLSISMICAQKVEIEKGISREQFPEGALAYIEERFDLLKRIKFYRELANDSITYEAKFLWRDYWYSVKFYPDGNLLDVEKKIKFQSTPKVLREKIEEQWRRDFKKFKVIKCQEQKSAAGLRYEIEVKGKGEKKTAYYEYLFEADGSFVSRSKIMLRPRDMTLY